MQQQQQQQQQQQHYPLLIFSGPSGVGKGTLLKALKGELPQRYGGPYWQGFGESTSCTTRAPREGEIPGQHYHFLSPQVFQAKIAAGEFLEYKASGDGSALYGTLKSEIQRLQAAKLLPVLEIETEGKKEVVKQAQGQFHVHSVFILPPALHCEATLQQAHSALNTYTELKEPLSALHHCLHAGLHSKTCGQVLTLFQRLNIRNTEAMPKRLLRLNKACMELQEAGHYDARIINDTLVHAVPKLLTLMQGCVAS